MCVCVCLSACLPACLCMCLSVCLHVCVFVFPSPQPGDQPAVCCLSAEADKEGRRCSRGASGRRWCVSALVVCCPLCADECLGFSSLILCLLFLCWWFSVLPAWLWLTLLASLQACLVLQGPLNLIMAKRDEELLWKTHIHIHKISTMYRH